MFPVPAARLSGALLSVAFCVACDLAVAQDGSAFGPGVDWSATATTRISIEGDINRDLDAGNQERLLSEALDAGLVIDAETRRALLTAELGLEARYFLGQDDDVDGTGRVDPRFTLRHIWTGKSYTFESNAGVTLSQASFTQLDDTGTSDATTTQISVTYGADLTQELSEVSAIVIGFEGSMIDFSEQSAGLIPSNTIGASIGWTRALSEATDLTLSAGLRNFSADNAASTRSQTLDLLATLAHRRTSRHDFTFSLGLSGVRTEEFGAGIDFDVGVTGGLGLDYTLQNLTTEFSFDQSVEPSSEGSLQSFSRIASALRYSINDRERLSVALSFSRRSPLGGTGDSLEFLSIRPVYAWDIAEQTEFSIGYEFRMSRDSALGTAVGHQVFIALERDFDLLQ